MAEIIPFRNRERVEREQIIQQLASSEDPFVRDMAVMAERHHHDLEALRRSLAQARQFEREYQETKRGISPVQLGTRQASVHLFQRPST